MQAIYLCHGSNLFIILKWSCCNFSASTWPILTWFFVNRIYCVHFALSSKTFCGWFICVSSIWYQSTYCASGNCHTGRLKHYYCPHLDPTDFHINATYHILLHYCTSSNISASSCNGKVHGQLCHTCNTCVVLLYVLHVCYTCICYTCIIHIPTHVIQV